MTRRRIVRKPNLEALRAAASTSSSDGGSHPSPGGELVSVKRDDPLHHPLFPAGSQYVVALLTLVVRVVYVCRKSNWWILHPDEIYQGVEVAHSLVHGYGFRMYEHLPAPDHVQTPAEEQEESLGFHSLRSFLYPLLYSIPFSLLAVVRSDLNLYLIGRLLHVCVSSTLPLAVYRLSNLVYTHHDISVLASVLVSSSLHLTIFGTHNLINSFVSPIFIFCLAQLLSVTRQTLPDSQKEQGIINGNAKSNEQSSVLNGTHRRHLETSKDDRNSDHRVERFSEKLMIKEILCGFVLGLLCYVRVDLVLLLFISASGWFILTVHEATNKKLVIRSLLSVLTGALSAGMVGGIVDFINYGSIFVSPYQWVTFNILQGLSSRVFGSGHFLGYLKNLNSVPSAVFLNMCTLIIVPYLCVSGNRKTVRYRTPVVFLLTTLLAIFTAYSLQSHKETRMLHNVFVLQAMVWAGAIRATLVALGSCVTLPMRRIYLVLVTCVILLSVNDCCRNFPSSHDKSNQAWAFNGHWDSGSVNTCLDHIRQQEDVSGLFLDYTLYAMGGFSIMRKDIPLIAKVHHEYYEFDPRDLPKYRHSTFSGLRLVNRLSDIMYVKHSRYILGKLYNDTRYNYIITKNMRLFRPLGFTNIYNCSEFRILKHIPKPGNESMISRIRLSKELKSGKFELNATILECEGAWLFTAGMYSRAVERLHAAISLNTSRIRPYQMLSLSYSNMDRMAEAAEVEKQCFDLHTFPKCIEPQPRLVLSEDYNLDV